MKKWYTLALLAAVLLISACVYLPNVAQNSFYYPEKEYLWGTPENDGLVYEEVTFQSSDGLTLHGWFVPALTQNQESAKGTVILVHGNAANISNHWHLVNWLPQEGFNVFVFDYRGYGHSEGKPSFKGTTEDTIHAIEYIRSRPDVAPDQLLVIGQSLGGNNAIAAIGSLPAEQKRGICAILIDSTFFSYSSIANDKLSGAGLLINDKYSASQHIQQIAPIPSLFIHGTADQVIPYSHTQRLFEIAPEPKTLIIIPGGGHITALSSYSGSTYRNQVITFFDNALQTCPTQQ